VNSKSPESSGFKGVARRVVLGAGLLFVVGGIFVVMYASSQQSTSVSKTPVAIGLAAVNPCAGGAGGCALAQQQASASAPQPSKDNFQVMNVIDNVLHEAALVEKLKTKEGPAAKDAAKEMDSALGTDAASGSSTAFNAVVGKYKEQIRTALEEVAEELEPEQAAAKDMLITSETLQKINGLTDTPELAPAADLGGSATVQGDMCFESPEAKQRLLQAVEGRRLWAGNLWPNKAAIPYCFHPSIAPSSKKAFLHACAHISSIVPCIGFAEVSVKSSDLGTCYSDGIFVQSKQATEGGCWSYVGKSSKQQLNLEAQGCDSLGTAAHEILHALGVAHEQARPDYSSYITILWQNIKSAERHNYDTNPNADTRLAYDIMSLMHYGDTDFGINGQKTMVAKASHRGLMGNRMGLTKYDAEQLANMYQCEYKKYSLCTNDPTKCTYDDCMCHQDPESHGSIVKEVQSNGCKRCVNACLDDSSSSCSNNPCGCASGFTKKTLNMLGGGSCYQCKPGSTPAPTPASTSAPTPASTTAPSATCKFPTSPTNCDQKSMPGCTTCDGDEAWCFTTKGDGDWRYCTKDDNACYFPFRYSGKMYYDCTRDGGSSTPWCKKVGGGSKSCSSSDGFKDRAIPSPAPAPPPTPAPLPTGCTSSWTYQSITYTNGCLKFSDGKNWCVTQGGKWRVCHADEDICSFPFLSGGKNYTQCQAWGAKKWCDTVGGGWKYC